MIDEENLQENCKNVGTFFLQELVKLRDEYEVVGDVRGKGLMLGLELVNSKVREELCSCPCLLYTGGGGYVVVVLPYRPPGSQCPPMRSLKYGTTLRRMVSCWGEEVSTEL